MYYQLKFVMHIINNQIPFYFIEKYHCMHNLLKNQKNYIKRKANILKIGDKQK